MKFLSHYIYICALMLVFLCITSGFVYAEKIEDLKPYNYVNDYAEVLDATQEDALNQKLSALEKATGAQVAIVTIHSMEGDYIEHYAVKLFEAWKIGNAKLDNGALLLVSIDDRQMRLEVGYGLEPTLTDGWSTYILNELLQPSFKRGEYGVGLSAAVDTIGQIVAGEQKDVPQKVMPSNSLLSLIFNLAPFIFIFGFTFFEWLAAILGRTKSWWLGGIIGGLIGGFVVLIVGVSAMTEIVTLILVLLGFVFDYIVSKNYSQHKRGILSGPPDWWSGGTWGPGGGTWTSSSGGSSWGGFGGGSSGGGGASGSW